MPASIGKVETQDDPNLIPWDRHDYAKNQISVIKRITSGEYYFVGILQYAEMGITSPYGPIEAWDYTSVANEFCHPNDSRFLKSKEKTES